MSDRDALLQELKALDGETKALSQKVAAAVKRGDKVAKADSIPTEFTGIVRGYRYAAGKKGEMPTHRFELECGQGLWMFVSCTSQFFDRFMENMDMGEKPVAKGLNGKVVTVQRNLSQNALVPVKFLGEGIGTDSNGKLLWVGAKVRTGTIAGVIEKAKDNGNGTLLSLSGVDGYAYDADEKKGQLGYQVYTFDVVRVD